MPLGTRVWGTLALADTRRRPDAAWVVDMLRTVADTAADAIARLETQAALRDSERNYRGLVDNLRAGVVVHAPDTRILWSSPMASQLLCLTAEQMRGLAAVDPVWRFIREDGTPMPPTEYPVERVAASGSPLQDLILGILTSERNTPTWVQCEAHPIRDDQGQIQQIVVTFFDVTEHVRALRALQQSQEWLQLAMENSRSFAFEWDPQSDRVRRSATCAAILGLGGEAAEHDTGQGFFQRLVPADRVRLGALLESLRPDAARYHAEYRVTRGDGGIVVLEEAAQGFFDAQGRLQRLVGAATDITERRAAAEALQKNRDLLNAMGRMAGVGGWEFNLETSQQVWTETIYDIHELDKACIPTVEQGVAFYTPESRPIIAEAVRRAIDLGEPYDLELAIVTAKGRRRWVHTIGRAVREGRRTIAVSGTLQDITERKQAEVELDRHRHHLETLVEARTRALNEQMARVREQEHLLIHQARFAAMGEMLGNIAHQWRQPLSALALVLGNLQDAARHQELTPEYLARKIADAHRLIDKMSTTISDFRDFFRPDKPSETFELSQPVAAALGLMAASLKTRGIAVVTDFCEEARTTGRLNEYSQVILNLLSNAKDAILARHPDGGQIVVRVDRDGDQARVRVTDDGGGIAQAALARLFEPYFSTKPDGTGIGLYMSKMIIEKGMGGRLAARNLETGAEFTIATPLAPQDQ